eukprot:scaffold678523_cov55-Attheya_sp.AAC.3
MSGVMISALSGFAVICHVIDSLVDSEPLGSALVGLKLHWDLYCGMCRTSFLPLGFEIQNGDLVPPSYRSHRTCAMSRLPT